MSATQLQDPHDSHDILDDSCSFSFDLLAGGNVCLAMDDGVEPKGFRAKWRKTGDAVAASVVDAGVPEEVPPDEPNDNALQSFLEQLGNPLPSDYAPTTPEVQDDDVIVDLGGTTTVADDDALISDTFVRGVKHTGFTMPWETPLMSQIFGETVSCPSLAMPMNWGMSTSLSKAANDLEPGPKMPAEC